MKSNSSIGGDFLISLNELYTVTIEDVNIFGNGVCRIENTVVFVDKALIGEICEIEIVRIYKSYAYGKVKRIIKKSEKRERIACSHFGKCGGCSFLHTTFENENSIKEKYVKDTFKKAKIEINVEKICAPIECEYRNKIVLFFDGEGFGYKKEKTNEIVIHEKCILNEYVFDKIAKESAKLFNGKGVRAISIRKSTDDEITLCVITCEKLSLVEYVSKITILVPEIKNIFYSVCSDKEIVLEKQKYIRIYGEGYIYDSLCDLRFRISPESFYQVNHLCAEKLYEKVVSLADLSKDSKCADLFCGTGTIGIICAKRTGSEVYGVEIVEKAIEDAKYNAELNVITNVRFEAQDASKFNEKVDTIIVDPPRKGLSKFMIDTLLRLNPQKIVYVSCNVDTLVRDIKILTKEYIISSPVSIFNMFPKTSHVESVVCLRKE